MFSQTAVFYPHRHNSNGSFNSICLTCFATFATAKTESELLEYDQRHIPLFRSELLIAKVLKY